MKFLNSTRVKAPNSIGDSGNQGNDSFTLKLDSRGVEDDILVLIPPTEKPESKRKLQKNTKTQNPKKSKSLVTCREHASIGTFNIRTAREDYKRLELAETFLMSQMEVLGVQEHRIIHEEPIKIEKFKKGVCLITSSAWRNSGGASNGGVGFMVTKKAYGAISLIKSYGPRVLTVSFDGNPRLTVITVYSPTEASTDEDAESFHNTVRQAIADVPAHNLLLLVGDMNARLGKSSMDDRGGYFHDRTNRNGELLRDTALAGGLEISNHRFRKKAGKMWTFMSDGTLSKGLIDYIMIRKKWRNSLKNTEAYNFFNSLGSDHRVVICKLQLSLRKSKRSPRRVCFDFSSLKQDPDLQSRYTVEVNNRFSSLMDASSAEETSATAKYEKFLEAVNTTNADLLPKRSLRKADDPASDPRVQEARRELTLAKDRYHEDACEVNRESVVEKKDELKTCYKNVEEEGLSRRIRMVEVTADRCKNKESWSLVYDITGTRKSSCGLIDGGSAEARLKNWKTHFSKLLGQPPSVPDNNLPIRNIHPTLDIEPGPFTIGELSEAKKQLVEGKACGADGIPAEVIKRANIDEIVLNFCNEALSNNKIPDQWKISHIVPVPKTGDLTKTDNYRGISLTSIICKTLNRMILNRMKPCIENLLRDNQNGFRPGRSTTSHILALRRILEGAKAKNLTAVMLFIDFKKAFDSVHRGLLMKILRAYGIPEEIVRLIESIYSGTWAKVITADGLTEIFEILAGVLQGDTLAPYLFVIVIDYIMTVVIGTVPDAGFTIRPARSRRVKGVKLVDADFADDIALTTDTLSEAQSLLDSLETAARSIGLMLNDDKTKFMAINIPCENGALTTSTGKSLKKVDDFKYLGAWVATTEHDFVVRKAKAWAACHKMKKIWKSDLRRDLKVRLFQATVESILLYGSETWTMKKSLINKIDGCYTRMLRMALNVSWTSHTTNRVVYGRLPRVSSKIQERRMRLAGHIHRHEDLIAQELLLWEPTQGVRGRGRPALTFVDTLRSDTGLDSTMDIGTLMADRQLWRDFIKTRTMKPP